MANEALNSWTGSPTTVIAMTGTIADGIFSTSATATVSEFTNTLNYTAAKAVLNIPDTFLVAPTTTSVDLYMYEVEIDGVSDDVTVPTTTLAQGAKFVGSFKIHLTDAIQVQECIISLVGVRKCAFAIQNNTGTTMSYTTGATVKIEALTYGTG